MIKTLVLSDKSLLTRKEEKELAGVNVQITRLSKANEVLLQTGGRNYDIIVIDESLCGGEIHEVCLKLRGTTTALIIVLGDTPSWEMWEKSDKIGFDRYYRKPVPPQELLIKLRLAACELEYKKSLHSPGNDPAEIFDIEEKPVETACITENEINPDPNTETAAASESSARIWQDPRVAGLLGGLLNGRIKQLNPEIDLRLNDGFSYREADAVMGIKGKETALILESLARENLLLKQEFEKIFQSPTGSFQLIPVERCPQCDSPQLTRGQLIEHFNCGHIGLEDDFMKGLNQVCPKCKKELKLIGTDYRKPGMRYVCRSCKGVFPSPAVKCRCLKTGEIYKIEELREVALYSYRLNDATRQRLEFELEPKKQLITFLKKLGYEIKEAVQVQGKSGATHTIDLLASKDDILTRHTVAIGILAAPNNETSVSIDSLFSFDSKVYDAGIENKMVIAVPGLTTEALKFAERQGVRVYGLEDLRASLYSKTQETDVITVTREHKQGASEKADMSSLGPRGWLKWLLEKRGYYVGEKLKVKGRSGTEHILDMYAEKDDGIIKHKLAACVILNEKGLNSDINEVIQFDTAAYDSGIRDKIIISVPGLSKEAKQFAEYQRIKVMEAKNPDEFSRLEPADSTPRRFSALLTDL